MFNRVYIEISNICNLQCTFCPVVGRDKDIMSPESFQRVLRDVAPLTKEICIHLMGEPLAHPKIKDILQLIAENNIPVQVTTNGITIKSKMDLILDNPMVRQINFSVQSYKDNFPEGDFGNYMAPIFEFTKRALRQREDLYINYRVWNIGRNSEIEKQNNELYQLIEEKMDVSFNRNIELGAIKSKKLTGRLYLHFDSHFEWPSLDAPYEGEKGRCHGLSSHFGIHADGTVVPCCLDKEAQINLGNCLDTNILDILNSERAVKMVDGFKQNVLVEKLCQHCSFIKRFQ